MGTYRNLVASVPLDRNTIVTAVERIADQIQARDDCDRITAMKRAVDQNPRLAEEYRRAMGW